MARTLNAILICGIIGSILLAWMSPAVISVLFTPPVSFGTNCEPAADWAMQKMIRSQIFGLICGAIVGASITWWLKKKRSLKQA